MQQHCSGGGTRLPSLTAPSQATLLKQARATSTSTAAQALSARRAPLTDKIHIGRSGPLLRMHRQQPHCQQVSSQLCMYLGTQPGSQAAHIHINWRSTTCSQAQASATFAHVPRLAGTQTTDTNSSTASKSCARKSPERSSAAATLVRPSGRAQEAKQYIERRQPQPTLIWWFTRKQRCKVALGSSKRGQTAIQTSSESQNGSCLVGHGRGDSAQ